MTKKPVRRLIVVLGDQLSDSLSALAGADPALDLILMAEVRDEATYSPHHPQKLVLVFSAMRHFARRLESRGFHVHYHSYDPDSHWQNLGQAVAETAAELKPESVRVTQCGEWRLHCAMLDWDKRLDCPLEILPDSRFFATPERFREWARGRKQWRMEYFYRELRRDTGLLMDAEGKPEGGEWNYDSDNRRKWQGKPPVPAPFTVPPDAITREVMAMVETHFSHHFGSLEGFGYAVTREQALAAMDHFVRERLPHFGDYQDAMADQEDTLFHSLLSPYLNCGLLLPREVCEAVQAAYYRGEAPLNAVEGFIRQILGWREFVRGLYWATMPDYGRENRLGNSRPLPAFYWSGETGMRCMAKAIDATRRNAHAHHIQRLMVTGNFALLAGVDPDAICDWYLAVYIDAYEWVELPNVRGMVMHADGGLLGSKPYAASGKYIHRMSDYCKQCRYNVQKTTEEDACPFNSLYWHFIDRHQETFRNNPRMGMIYRNWQKQDPDKKAATLARAEALLSDPDNL